MDDPARQRIRAIVDPVEVAQHEDVDRISGELEAIEGRLNEQGEALAAERTALEDQLAAPERKGIRRLGFDSLPARQQGTGRA
jgi:hypothetical protein